jgi:hypothetical protein
MMDWSKVASRIGSTAPLLAGLIGGPIGLGVTAAAAIISHTLGTPNDPQAIETALNDPTALDKLRQAEGANAVQLQQLVVTAAQARLAYETDMARIQAGDRADARAMGIANRDWVPKVLAMAVTGGFFGILLLMALRALPHENRDLVNVVIGALGTAWISIIGYYFGTSAGSMRKTELLAKPSVPITADSAVTLREPAAPPAPTPRPHAGESAPHADMCARRAGTDLHRRILIRGWAGRCAMCCRAHRPLVNAFLMSRSGGRQHHTVVQLRSRFHGGDETHLVESMVHGNFGFELE